MSFIQAKAPATHDFYRQVHKGLRLALSQLLLRIGACDADDADSLKTLLADLRFQMEVSEHHLANEDLYIHTALEERAPGAAARLDATHADHRETFATLEVMIRGLETCDAATRAARLRGLYLRFSTFVAEDFAHMAEEEQLILPVLQSLFTNEELMAIEAEIVAALEPRHLMTFGRAMIPAATRSERLVMVGNIRAHAPPQAFQALMELSARPSLNDSDFAHLCEGLGISPAYETRGGESPSYAHG